MDQQTKDLDLLNVLVTERVDRTKNTARYNILSAEPTLFAPVCDSSLSASSLVSVRAVTASSAG